MTAATRTARRRPRTPRSPQARRRLLAAVVGMLALAPAAAPAPAAPARQTARSAVALRVVALARAELAKNVHEVPDGSNRAPAIRRYETATAGAVYGAPWCAYFVSYIALHAGAPIGPGGSGMGYVPYIRAWAHQTGRWRATPRAGDLITFPEHVGIVETVYANHTLTTIEGNAGNAVRRRWRSWSEATGYVRLVAGSGPAPVPAPVSPRPPVSPSPVHERLVARIHAYPGLAVAPGQRVDFTSNDSSGDVRRSDWDFDGNGSYEAHGDSASHTWTTPGTYTVRLKVTDSRGKTSTASARVLVRPSLPPVARLTVSADHVQVGDTVRADASGSSDPDGRIVSYSWDLNGDGNFADDGPHHSFTYTEPGDYDAGVRVTDDAGNVAEAHVHIHVDPLPGPVATVHCDRTSITAGDQVHCWSDDSASPTRIVRHHWDTNGDGVNDARGSSVYPRPAHAGDLVLTETVTDQNGATSVASATVHVADRAPTAAVSAPSTIALGSSATIDASASADADGSIARVEFDLDGDGVYERSGTSRTTVWAPSAPGTYVIGVRVTDDAGLTTVATATVRVTDAAPVARITLPARVVSGLDATFDATRSTDADSAIARYDWDLDGNGTYETTAVTPTVRYTGYGPLTVRLRVTDVWGASSTTTASITVLAPPIARAALSTSPALAGSSLTFTAAGSSDPDGTITRYDWDFNEDGVTDRTSTTSQTATWTYATSGTKHVKLTVTDSSGLQTSVTLTVTVG